MYPGPLKDMQHHIYQVMYYIPKYCFINMFTLKSMSSKFFNIILIFERKISMVLPISGYDTDPVTWTFFSPHVMGYPQASNISRTKSQHLKDSHTVLWLSFAESLEARCWAENEDVVGVAPTGDAPTTSEWSTILSPTKVRLILEVLR